MEQLRNHKNSKHGQLKFSCDFREFKSSVNWRLKQHVLRRHSFPKLEKIRRKRKMKSVLKDKRTIMGFSGQATGPLIFKWKRLISTYFSLGFMF